MSGYMKLGNIKGNVSEKDHKDWITIETFSHPIVRNMNPGAKGHQRTKGETALGDIHVQRVLDRSSPKIAEACAKGTLIPEVQVHLCSEIDDREIPFYSLKLKNCIITNYCFNGMANNTAVQTETMSLNFSAIDWEFDDIDPNSNQSRGKVPANYVSDGSA